MAVIAVLGVAVLVGAGVLAVRFVRDRIVAPLALRSRIESGLAARALKEYPGYASVRFDTASGTGAAGEAVSSVFITLADGAHEGFTYTAAYSAPLAVAGDPSKYENDDEFFRVTASSAQPADSFAAMWTRTRPTYQCEYVLEQGEPTDATRTYLVGYSLPTKAGVPVKLKTMYFAYAPSTDAWTETSRPKDALEVYEDSLVDTATAVARALPAFEVAGPAQMPNGSWVAVVRHRKHPTFRMVVDSAYLTPDLTSDDEVTMFGPDADIKRADAFVRMWIAVHPHVVIDRIQFDPDMAYREDYIEVSYVGSVDDAGVWTKEKSVRLRYTKSHTWVTAK